MRSEYTSLGGGAIKLISINLVGADLVISSRVGAGRGTLYKITTCNPRLIGVLSRYIAE